MPRFLIDANLPYRFDLWQGEAFQHVYDLGDDLPDAEIWRHAREHDLVIVTKDADFSHWIMLSDPPPKVVRFRVGNLRLRDFHALANRVWPSVMELLGEHKLIIVWSDRIEAVA